MKETASILQITVRADIGGGPEHLFRLIKGLSPQFDCVIAAPMDEPYFKLFKEIVIEENVVEIPHRKFRLSSLLLLRKLIKQRDISIIHSHGKGAGIYSRLLGFLTGKKVIHTLHGFHVGEYNLFQKELYIFLEKLLAFFTDKFITVSEGEKKEILQAKICNPGKIIVIPNGVELPNDSVTTSNFEQTPRKFISFSRFNYQKNTELIIEICKTMREVGKLENIEFHVYGDGENIEKIKRKVKLHKLEKIVILHGADSNARAKLVEGFCYISTSRWEGLPLSLLEAMAAGLPVLATNVVGNKDIVVNNENGLLFEMDNLEDCIDKIGKLVTEKVLWTKLSANTKKTAEEKFSIAKMIQETEKVYLN